MKRVYSQITKEEYITLFQLFLELKRKDIKINLTNPRVYFQTADDITCSILERFQDGESIFLVNWEECLTINDFSAMKDMVILQAPNRAKEEKFVK